MNIRRNNRDTAKSTNNNPHEVDRLYIMKKGLHALMLKFKAPVSLRPPLPESQVSSDWSAHTHLTQHH